MDFINYYITYKNFEEQAVEIQLQDLDTLEDPPGDTVNVNLEASDSPTLEPSVMESVSTDDDKTQAIKAKRLRIGFNSGEYDVDGVDTVVNVQTFSDGGDGRFLVRILTGAVALPFLGNLVLDDNSEAFQPRPNPVQLTAADGLNSLRDVELRTTTGELPIGHFSIIDYIVMCLNNLAPGQEIHAVMNIYEEDQNPTTEHAFEKTFLDALTFEKEVDTREDCLTVLGKILDWCGCFISYDHDGWWIIRWDEYDNAEGNVTTMRVGTFSEDGTFNGYTNVSFDKTIAHDQTPEYEGYRLSMDSAQRRFQRKASKVVHNYKFQQPKEVPCNGKFTRGTPDDIVMPLITFVPECWTLRRGVPGAYGTPLSEVKIAVNHDANDYETERYLYITPEGTSLGSSTDQVYLESEAIELFQDDKFNCDLDWRTEANVGFGANYNLIRFYLNGNDGSHWLLGHEDIGNSSTPLKWWNTSNFTVNTAAGGIDIDFTLIDEMEWQNLSFEAPPAPVTGKLYIWLHQLNQTVIAGDDTTINYTGINFERIPLINGTYKTSLGQELTVSAENESRRIVEKEMFLSDSPRPYFKGATKKFDGTNYVLTGNWTEWNNVSFTNVRFAKYIVFQWWNQFRKTRTVIETDVQGINSDVATGIPGLIHRWKISHDDQTDKYFMMTSLRNLNFRNCGWQGVFVETSDADGDRVYTDTFEFKYIQ
jgi:hypothetical protein